MKFGTGFFMEAHSNLPSKFNFESAWPIRLLFYVREQINIFSYLCSKSENIL
jgi:hypothetical protein